MDKPKTPVKFDIYEGDQLVRTEILTEQTIKIGKLSSSHVRIDDDSVSRMHAVVEVNGPDDVVVLDLGSATGTFVNGQKVTKHKLSSGDRLTLGNTTLVVTIAGQSQVAAPSLDSADYAATAQVRPSDLQAAAQQIPAFDDEEDGTGERALEVLAMWGSTVLDVKHFDTGHAAYTIGTEGTVSHFVPEGLLPDEPYPLATADGGEMVVNVPDGVVGEVMLDGQVFGLDELKAAGKLSQSRGLPRSHSLRLPPRARCRLAFAHITFLINSVPAAKKLPPLPFWQHFDSQIGRYVLAALVLHGLFAAVVMSIPDDAGRLSIDKLDMSDRWVEFMLKPESEKEDTSTLLDKLKEEAEAAKAARDEEGKAGKKDSPDKNKRMAIEGPPDQKELELARERDRQEALDTADAAFNSLEGELSAVWGESDRAVGNDAISALGNMFGDQVGEAGGVGGLGVAGIGRGGGGFSETSIGVGNVGTAARGGGRGGSGYGRGVARYGGKRARQPKVIPGRPIISGSLDKEIIRRIIRQHRAEYRYCYEKELNRKRDLNGKIVVKFVISGRGSVISTGIIESTMGNRNVEQCLRGKIKRWVFPEPKGGGTVIVKYPFIFKPS